LLQKSLKVHKEREHEGKISPYICGVCGKSFFRLDSLNLHQAAVHEGIRHPCDQCYMQYKDPKNLRKHIRHDHEGVPRQTFPCKRCGYETSNLGSLKKHQETARCDPNKSWAYPHKCHLCNSKFTTEKNLKKHSRIHEPDYEPYTCSLCKKTFTMKWNLVKHEKDMVCRKNGVTRNVGLIGHALGTPIRIKVVEPSSLEDPSEELSRLRAEVLMLRTMTGQKDTISIPC